MDGTLSANGSTEFLNVRTDGVHVSIQGDFGGGSVALEQEILGTVFPIFDSGTATARTAADDIFVLLGPTDKIRLTLSGATSPSITWSMRGNTFVVSGA